MRRALIGTVLGFILGAGFAVLLALVIHLNRPRDPESAPYYSITDGTSSTIWLDELTYGRSSSSPQPKENFLSAHLYLGILLGGGFGGIVGVVVGATGALVKAVRESAVNVEAGFSSSSPPFGCKTE